MRRSLALLAVVAACRQGAPPGASVTADAASSPIAASSAPVSPPLPSANAEAGDVERRLDAYYAKYVDGSTFDFLRHHWAPAVERYLSRTGVPVDDLIKAVHADYAGKKNISLRVRPGSVVVRPRGASVLATLVLSTHWIRPPPPDARACGHLDDDMRWRPSSNVEHDADVRAEIVLDPRRRFVAYDEHGVVTVPLRVKSQGDSLRAFPSMPVVPARDVAADAGEILVPDGTIVEALGESFACGLTEGEVDTVRNVRLGDREVWLLASWTFSTGRSYVGEDVLVPVSGRE